jgi:hypothetical protein
MAFIIIPIVYIAGSMDDEDDDITRLKRKGKAPIKKADITINTNTICSYVGEDETNHTMVYMADGNCYECLFSRDRFDTLLKGAEAVVDLSTLTDN